LLTWLAAPRDRGYKPPQSGYRPFPFREERANAD
jgi:hypothetical protein